VDRGVRIVASGLRCAGGQRRANFAAVGDRGELVGNRCGCPRRCCGFALYRECICAARIGREGCESIAIAVEPP